MPADEGYARITGEFVRATTLRAVRIGGNHAPHVVAMRRLAGPMRHRPKLEYRKDPPAEPESALTKEYRAPRGQLDRRDD